MLTNKYIAYAVQYLEKNSIWENFAEFYRNVAVLVLVCIIPTWVTCSLCDGMLKISSPFILPG